MRMRKQCWMPGLVFVPVGLQLLIRSSEFCLAMGIAGKIHSSMIGLLLRPCFKTLMCLNKGVRGNVLFMQWPFLMGTQWHSERHKRCARTIRWDVQTDAELRNAFRAYTKIQCVPFLVVCQNGSCRGATHLGPHSFGKVGLFSGSSQSRFSMKSLVIWHTSKEIVSHHYKGIELHL